MRASPAFRVRESVDEAGGRLVLRGELDLVAVPDLQAALDRVERAGAPRIVIDLAGLDFIDATGLRCLLDAEARGRASGRPVVLVRHSAAVQRLIALCRLQDDDRASLMMDPPPAA